MEIGVPKRGKTKIKTEKHMGNEENKRVGQSVTGGEGT